MLNWIGASLIANITRLFFWLGDRFEFALLVQSMLMIIAQVGGLLLLKANRIDLPLE